MRHLLVTNDFPPKVGGIQSYLWELWRRLPPDDVTVLTTANPEARSWDSAQDFRIVRSREPVLLPHPGLARRVARLAERVDASLVLFDPVLPLGLIAASVGRPFGFVLHGAEITVPGRLQPSGAIMGRMLRAARLVVAAGGYPLAEAERAAGRSLRSVVVPPGVDVERFVPLTAEQVESARARHGLGRDHVVISGVSRLVPRKGFDTFIAAVAEVGRDHPSLIGLIAGTGRDDHRLRELVGAHRAPVRMLGRVADADLPALYGMSDVFMMLCRDRWGGLEQEGFGIVFLEAAACAIPQIAGRSGGSHEAVEDEVTGLIVDRPDDVGAVTAALRELVESPAERLLMGGAARTRAVEHFSYDVLARRLAEALDAAAGTSRSERTGRSS